MLRPWHDSSDAAARVGGLGERRQVRRRLRGGGLQDRVGDERGAAGDALVVVAQLALQLLLRGLVADRLRCGGDGLEAGGVDRAGDRGGGLVAGGGGAGGLLARGGGGVSGVGVLAVSCATRAAIEAASPRAAATCSRSLVSAAARSLCAARALAPACSASRRCCSWVGGGGRERGQLALAVGERRRPRRGVCASCSARSAAAARSSSALASPAIARAAASALAFAVRRALGLRAQLGGGGLLLLRRALLVGERAARRGGAASPAGAAASRRGGGAGSGREVRRSRVVGRAADGAGLTRDQAGGQLGGHAGEAALAQVEPALAGRLLDC